MWSAVRSCKWIILAVLLGGCPFTCRTCSIWCDSSGSASSKIGACTAGDSRPCLIVSYCFQTSDASQISDATITFKGSLIGPPLVQKFSDPQAASIGVNPGCCCVSDKIFGIPAGQYTVTASGGPAPAGTCTIVAPDTFTIDVSSGLKCRSKELIPGCPGISASSC